MKARDVSAATAGRSGWRRSMILMGAMAAFVCAVVFAALLGTGASSAGAVAACPNEAIRAAQRATQLGDCRAFERVSPDEKGDGDIIAEGEAITASKFGNGATFESRLPFGDTVGSGVVGRSAYLARRSAAGWSVHSVTPQGQPSAVQVLFASTKTEVFSDDLTHTLTWGYDLPGSTDDTPNRMNLYVEDTATRALQTVSAYQRPGETPGEPGYDYPYVPFEFLDASLYGASADLSHVALASRTQFLPPDPAIGYPPAGENVYTWDEGVLHLAGILPDGNVPPEGSTVQPKGPKGVRGTMSADGSRQSFIAPPTSEVTQPQLYLRIDNDRTAWVSEPENPSFLSPSNEPKNVRFEGMTPDGKEVFFATDSPLLEADTADGPDLYRWSDGPDPAGEDNLTLITNEGKVINNVGYPTYGGALVGMSNDASRVYIQTTGGELRAWEEGVGIKTADPSVVNGIFPDKQLALTSTQPGPGRVSPDGNWVAYIKEADSEMYLYDRAAGILTCASCPGNASLVPTITNGGLLKYVGFRPRFLSDDGRVFFTSTGALVPEDTNGVADVYEYDGPSGTLSLLSSGKGKDPSEFADASADGSDVFFATRGQLVATDHDEFVDLYDSRTGGGFTEAGSSASGSCEGEACQAAGGASPPGPVISSRSATSGNLAKPRSARCAKGKKVVHRNGKSRCTKKRQKHHAKSGRGAQR